MRPLEDGFVCIVDPDAGSLQHTACAYHTRRGTKCPHQITAHGNKTTFYLTDALDAQYVYNAARNIEIAVWLLASRKNAQGLPLLLSDEINESQRNLSFEREFGKVIERLDLLASLLTEKYRRAVITYVQNLLGGTFLQFLPVR